MTELLALSLAELTEVVGGPGRAKAVKRSLAAGRDPRIDPALSPRVRARLGARPSTSLALSLVVPAADGTRRLVFTRADGGEVEAVLLRSDRRTTLCVSSQLGCGRGCVFCASGRLGLARGLSAAEIVAQYVAGCGEAERAGIPAPENVVFMGMGEPLDNLDEVERAVHLLVEPGGFGLAPRRVTVSTVGTTGPAIARAAGLGVHLAWSLHAADDEVRRRLVPSARRSVAELIADFAAALGPTRRGLFVELTLLADLNDREVDAAAVVAAFADFPTALRFNLLPMNPSEGAPAELRPSPPARVQAFAAALRAAGHFVMTRRARGDDARSACGQLVFRRRAQP